MRAHPGKCYFLLGSKTPQVVSISETITTSSTAGTLLGIIIDSEFNFENHLNSMCNKVSKKLMHLIALSIFACLYENIQLISV